MYLRILNLAAKTLECEVAAALTTLLHAQERFDDTQVAQMVARSSPTAPFIAPLAVDLRQYDALLLGGQAC
jgi:hypothetical protein